MKNKNMLSNIISLLSADFVSQALRLLRGVILAGALGPELMGVWATIYIYMMYGEQMHFGVYNALTRQIPIYSGKGDEGAVRSYSNTAFMYTIAVSILSGALLLGSGILYPSQNELYSIGLKFVAVLVVTQQWIQLYRFILTGSNRFQELSKLQALYAVISFVSIGLVVPFGFLGQMWSLLLTDIVFIIVLIRKLGIQFSFKGEWRILKDMVYIGFPIYVAGLLFTILMSLNRVIIAQYLGAKELGYFSLAFMVFNIVYLVPEGIRRVLYVRMGEHYGKNNEDIQSLDRYVTVASSILAYLMPLILILCIIGLYVFVPLLLPSYSPGLSSVSLYVVGILFFALASLCANVLNIVKKQLGLYVAQICAIGVTVIGGIVFIEKGYGLSGVSYASGIAFFMYYVIIVFYTLSILRKSFVQKIWFLIKLLVPSVVMVLICLLFGRFMILFLHENEDFSMVQTIFYGMCIIGAYIGTTIPAVIRSKRIKMYVTEKLQSMTRRWVKS